MLKNFLVLSVLVSILLAACSLSAEVPATEQVPTIVADVLPPDVAVKIQNHASGALGVAADQINIETVQRMEWPDSCLGLGAANESCAQVVTPGWLVAFTVNGTEYRYRVDETGTNIRQEP